MDEQAIISMIDDEQSLKDRLKELRSELNEALEETDVYKHYHEMLADNEKLKPKSVKSYALKLAYDDYKHKNEPN
jgi:hypothetical protein